MANVNAPFGLIAVRDYTAAPYNGRVSVFYVPSTYAFNIFPGDPVIPTGSADPTGNYPIVQLATAGTGNYLLGAMVGVIQGSPSGGSVVTVTRDQPIYHQASTSGYIAVSDNPSQMYIAQEDSVGGSLTIANAWDNVNLTAGAGGNTTTGVSSWQIQSSSAATSSSLQVRLLRLMNRNNNALGTNAIWFLRIVLNSLTNTTGI